MPESCCAVGCSQRRLKVVVFLFTEYLKEKYPSKLEGRRDWIKAIDRDWNEEHISRTRICGNQFVSG